MRLCGYRTLSMNRRSHHWCWSANARRRYESYILCLAAKVAPIVDNARIQIDRAVLATAAAISTVCNKIVVVANIVATARGRESASSCYTSGREQRSSDKSKDGCEVHD